MKTEPINNKQTSLPGPFKFDNKINKKQIIINIIRITIRPEDLKLFIVLPKYIALARFYEEGLHRLERDLGAYELDFIEESTILLRHILILRSPINRIGY